MKYARGFTQTPILASRRNAQAKQMPILVSGFTLIELLVVIAIVVLLAAIVLASLSDVRQRGQATRIIQDLEQIEQALLLFADDENIGAWWLETDFGLGADPTIQEIIDNTALSTSLSRSPVPPVGNTYQYDSDGDVFACGGGDQDQGVNIVLTGVPAQHLGIIDNIIDNSTIDDDCGRVTYSGDILYFKITSDRNNY